MKIKNILGERFGSLVVIEQSERTNPKQQIYWICRCDCGNIIEVRGDNLRRKQTKRCSDCRKNDSIYCGNDSVFVKRVFK